MTAFVNITVIYIYGGSGDDIGNHNVSVSCFPSHSGITTMPSALCCSVSTKHFHTDLVCYV